MSDIAYSDDSITRCPACGSEVWIHRVEFLNGDIGFGPKCFNCNVGLQVNFSTYEDAVSKWNQAVARTTEFEAEINRLGEMLHDSFQGHLLGELQRKDNEIGRLQSHLEEALELLKLADDDMWLTNTCKLCGASCRRDASNRRECLAGGGNFKWQYADRCEALKTQIMQSK